MNILIVSPHPDDETLGAGGTLLKRKSNGDKIYWLNVTNVKGKKGWNEEFLIKRERQIEKICDFFQFDDFCDLNLEPAMLENLDKGKIISEIGEYFKKIQPEWIILPNRGDAHSDHKVVYDSCMACSKVFRYPYIKKITTMEILSETDFGDMERAFTPNYFVDISDYMEKKIAALKIYDTEIGASPFPRSLEAVRALALLRGGMCGVRYAEAFKVIKWID